MTENEKKLRDLVKDVFSQEIKESLEKSEEKRELWEQEFSKKTVSEQNEILKRIEAIEKLPAQKIELPVANKPGVTKEYLYGSRVSRQLTDIAGRKEIKANPDRFPIMNDPQKRDYYAKHLLMIIKAATGNRNALEDYYKWENEVKASDPLQVGANAQGGFVVHDEFNDEVIACAALDSFALQDCRQFAMGANALKFPKEGTDVVVTWTAEEAAATQSEPTFAQVTLTANRLDAFSIASNELLNDSEIDIVSYLTGLFAEAIGQELDKQVLVGTGSPVSGILKDTTVFSVVMSTDNFSNISADNLLDMIGKIPKECSRNLKWYMHQDTLINIRQLKDTTNQYLFAPLASTGVPADIWGYPWFNTPQAPAQADTAASTGFVALSNMQQFYLGRRLATTTLDIDPFGEFTKYRTRFRIVNRWALAIASERAHCKLVTSA